MKNQLSNKLIKNLAEYIELMLEHYNSTCQDEYKLTKQDIIDYLTKEREK